MDTSQYDFSVVGGGIVGLSTAWHLIRNFPGKRIVVLEKEDRLAKHQSGHNSGVIHSGIYYKPGSFKAQFCRAGNRSIVTFCEAHNIAHDVCGKIIVATAEAELPLLEHLYQRGLQNGLQVAQMGSEEIREREPYVRGLAGIWVPSTGIADFGAVCRTYATLIERMGGDIRLNTQVKNVVHSKNHLVLETGQGAIKTRFAINCGGLHSDRLARSWGLDPKIKIIPFRGEYYELKPDRLHWVKNLIYPVPHPSFPFLGVHFTRTIGGGVHVGPNAVLSFKREGYRKTDFNFHDAFESLTYPGFIRLATKHLKEGMKEIVRSLSKKAFVQNARKMIPELRADDIIPSEAGVRAQALTKGGKLVDDFLFLSGTKSIHVLNAPSPAATSSIEIGQAIVERVKKVLQ